MNRDFSNFDSYLNSLLLDDYGQEPDAGHTRMLKQVMKNWIANMYTCHSVLDVGCGARAVAQPFFRALGKEYTGIALGKDILKCKALGIKNVFVMDMSFLEFRDEKFDLIFARHVAEHSPMPLLTLMEWRRVAKNWLCLIAPSPEVYGRVGRNHYSVLYPDQWLALLERAGWRMIWEDYSERSEYRFMCEKRRDRYAPENVDEFNGTGKNENTRIG